MMMIVVIRVIIIVVICCVALNNVYLSKSLYISEIFKKLKLLQSQLMPKVRWWWWLLLLNHLIDDILRRYQDILAEKRQFWMTARQLIHIYDDLSFSMVGCKWVDVKRGQCDWYRSVI